MIKLTPAPKFKVEAQLVVPGEEAPGNLELTVRWMPVSQRQAWFKAVEGKSDADAISEVVADWSGPLDEAGLPVPYSKEALATLLDNYDGAVASILTAIARGYREGRVKN